MPTLGWDRAYRSGDVVRNDAVGPGLRRPCGRPDQARRAPDRAGRDRRAAAPAPGRGQRRGGRPQDRLGQLDPRRLLTRRRGIRRTTALELLRSRMPAALVPRLAVVDDLPTRTSGKVDRDALPWPLPPRTDGPRPDLTATQAWLADIWRVVLAADVTDARARLLRLRRRVADRGAGGRTDPRAARRGRGRRRLRPPQDRRPRHLPGRARGQRQHDRPRGGRLRRRTQVGQMLSLVPLRTLAAARWSAWLMLGRASLHPWVDWLPTPPWWAVLVAVALFVLPPGRMAVAAGLARVVLRGVTVGQHPRGGSAHLRIWLAGRIQDELAATSSPGHRGSPGTQGCWAAKIGRGVDLHTVPPVTGFLTVGSRAAIESEVDLTGHWVDGDVLHVGADHIGARRGSARGACSAPVPRWARCRGGTRVRTSTASSRRASSGRVTRRAHGPARADRGRPSHPRGPAVARGVCRAVPPPRRPPAARPRRGRGRPVAPMAAPPPPATPSSPSCRGCRWPGSPGSPSSSSRSWSSSACSACSSTPATSRCARRPASRSGAPYGSSTRPGLAVPALLRRPHADLAAAARGPGSARTSRRRPC